MRDVTTPWAGVSVAFSLYIPFALYWQLFHGADTLNLISSTEARKCYFACASLAPRAEETRVDHGCSLHGRASSACETFWRVTP
jgi:hypothetical protein